MFRRPFSRRPFHRRLFRRRPFQRRPAVQAGMMAEVDRLFEQDPAEAGAPLQSNETAWVDSTTAECAYCGSFIRAEE